MDIKHYIANSCAEHSARIVELRQKIKDKSVPYSCRERYDRHAAMYEGFLINRANMLMFHLERFG